MLQRSTPAWAGLPPAMGRPLSAERALFLICQAEAHRRLSEPDDEGLGVSLIDDFDDEMEEDGPQQIV